MTTIFAAASAQDYCGVLVTNNEAGGTNLRVLGIKVIYNGVNDLAQTLACS